MKNLILAVFLLATPLQSGAITTSACDSVVSESLDIIHKRIDGMHQSEAINHLKEYVVKGQSAEVVDAHVWMVRLLYSYDSLDELDFDHFAYWLEFSCRNRWWIMYPETRKKPLPLEFQKGQQLNLDFAKP